MTTPENYPTLDRDNTQFLRGRDDTLARLTPFRGYELLTLDGWKFDPDFTYFDYDAIEEDEARQLGREWSDADIYAPRIGALEDLGETDERRG